MAQTHYYAVFFEQETGRHLNRERMEVRREFHTLKAAVDCFSKPWSWLSISYVFLPSRFSEHLPYSQWDEAIISRSTPPWRSDADAPYVPFYGENFLVIATDGKIEVDRFGSCLGKDSDLRFFDLFELGPPRPYEDYDYSNVFDIAAIFFPNGSYFSGPTFKLYSTDLSRVLKRFGLSETCDTELDLSGFSAC